MVVFQIVEVFDRCHFAEVDLFSRPGGFEIGDDIIAEGKDKRVISSPALEHVIALATVDDILFVVAGDDIVLADRTVQVFQQDRFALPIGASGHGNVGNASFKGTPFRRAVKFRQRVAIDDKNVFDVGIGVVGFLERDQNG